MKKLIRLFKIAVAALIVFSLYSFGNAIVMHYAAIDLERTMSVIEILWLAMATILVVGIVMVIGDNE